MIICKICGKEYKDLRVLGCHIIKAHKMPTKDYYDKYMATEENHECKQCGKPTSFLNMNVGYRPFCCNKCSMEYLKTNPEAIENAKIAAEQTFKKKYGGHPMQNDTVKHKMMKTVNKKYGGNISFKDANVKAKSDATMLKEYGTTSAFNSKVIKERAKNTIEAKYGVDNVFKLKEIQDKVHNTHLKKYGNEHIAAVPEIRKKIQNTVKEKYAVEHVMQNKDIAKKLSVSAIKGMPDKIKRSNDKYGVDFPVKLKDVRDKLKTVMHTEEYLNKRRNTLIQHFGIPYPPRNDQMVIDGNIFDSLWEIIFYLYHKRLLKDDIIRNTTEYLEYEYNAQLHKYYPDFIIDGKFYEVKGSHLLKYDDEHIKSKLAVCKDNNVIIVTKDEIDNMKASLLSNNITEAKDIEKYLRNINSKISKLKDEYISKYANTECNFLIKKIKVDIYNATEKFCIFCINKLTPSFKMSKILSIKHSLELAKGFKVQIIDMDKV